MSDSQKNRIIGTKEALGEAGVSQTTTQDLGSDSRGKRVVQQLKAKDVQLRAREAREIARAETRQTLPDENPDLVKYCTGFNCPLWKLRFGKAPATVERKNPELLNVEFVREKAMAKK